MESKEIRTLRAMAWARVKGEIMSIQDSYWDDDGPHREFRNLSEKFIKTVEDNGLAE